MKAILFILFFLILNTILLSQQSGDIMYFAQSADGKKEYNLSDRFTTGKLAVICKLVYPISYKQVFIQLDKYNMRTYSFEYHQRYEYSVDPNKKYLYFNNVLFDTPGFYRVFLLDDDNTTITSALIEIIEQKYLQKRK